MDSEETHQQQQNRNAAAELASPTSTSQAMHDRSSVGDFSLRQPQPQQARTLDASTQQPWLQLGMGRPITYVLPDVINSGGGANASNSSSGPPAKRGRGRPPLGSHNRQNHNSLGGGEGGPLTAHVIDVNAGEDIARKLMALMNQEPRDVCILSAHGDVSVAELQSNDPRGLVKYEGPYVIAGMSGTFSNTESNGTVTRTGNLNVSLAGLDFNIVGGCVGGMLVAGSQVKVVVGTFEPEGVKLSAASAPDNVLNSSGGGGPGLPQSQGPQCPTESLEENNSWKLLLNSTP